MLYQLSYDGTASINTEAGAETEDRTPDLILTMDVLYQLSYLGERAREWKSSFTIGASEGDTSLLISANEEL